MKLTCLSKGGGFYFPPCHMLDLCGIRFLLECPVDLSALAVFSPIPNSAVPRHILNNMDETGEDFPTSKRRKTGVEGREPAVGDLIKAVPWYKTVKSLHLWDFSLIDVVLVSSPMGMLGLPFLARDSKFTGKIYATEATARIGRIMMEELVSMNAEYIQFYGSDKEGSSPEWLKWEELEVLPCTLKKIILGEGGEDLGAWLPLYSAEDVHECMEKVQVVKYSEELCYNGIFILKAFSSGLEIGTSNWTVCSPHRNVTYLSSSIFESAHAMEFDYCSLQGNDEILFSDFSSLHSVVDSFGDKTERIAHKELEDELSHDSDILDDRGKYNGGPEMDNCLVGTSKSNEELDKIDYICFCIVESVKKGGSVLISIGRLGVILQLLEKLSCFLDSSNLKVPMYMISAAAEEMLAYTNSLPEWLCKERQQKLYSGEPLFGHIELIAGKKLRIFPALHSSNLLMTWEEPCIVFCPHWSLRLGPVVRLLHRWHVDCNSLLILEEEADANMALLPFKPVSLKVLQCAFLSGLLTCQVQPLLESLQAKHILFPEDLRGQLLHAEINLSSFLYYSENRTKCVPKLRDDSDAFLATELAFQLQPRRLPQENMAIARLKGQLLLRNGKYMLVSAHDSVEILRKKLHWGSVDPKLLLLALQGKGLRGSVKSHETSTDGDHYSIHVDGHEATIEASATQTIICAADETLTTQIYEAFCSVVEGI